MVFFTTKLIFARQNSFFHAKTHFSTAKKLIFPLQNSFFHAKTHFSTTKLIFHYKKTQKSHPLAIQKSPIVYCEYWTGYLDLHHRNWKCKKTRKKLLLVFCCALPDEIMPLSRWWAARRRSRRTRRRKRERERTRRARIEWDKDW